jgi:hypothetical protein
MTGQELLVTLAALAAIRWAVRAWFWPFAPCRACEGRKTNPGSTRKRYGMCKRCGGTGQRQVLGSKSVHKAASSLRSAARRRREAR